MQPNPVTPLFNLSKSKVTKAILQISPFFRVRDKLMFMELGRYGGVGWCGVVNDRPRSCIPSLCFPQTCLWSKHTFYFYFKNTIV